MRTFENQFVIVPAKELERMVKTKSAGKKGIYSFYISFDGKRVVEERDEIVDYSGYLDRWDLISQALIEE